MNKNRVASIMASDFLKSQQQIKKIAPFSDIIELRLDYWHEFDIADIARLRQSISLPVIFTLRKQSQGGQCTLDEQERLQRIKELAELSPDYFDLEYDVPNTFLLELQKHNWNIQWICSYHDFEKMPLDLEKLFQTVASPAFDIFKIAVCANDVMDTLRFLIFLKKISASYPVIGMAMGEYGHVSRILAPVVGSLWTYGCVDAESSAAPGQMTLRDLTKIYRVHELNQETAIYALLGDPVAQSPGHIFHNEIFASQNKNAVYVKLCVTADKLAQAVSLLRQLPFEGFSVTMPHKESIVPLLDDLSQEAKTVQIVNTIKREHNRYFGFNTDGAGAVAVLEKIKSLTHQNIFILGAGGSAKALAHALMSKGAKITLFNRTLSRAAVFTDHYGGCAMSFDALFAMEELPCDILINTLPAEAFGLQCAHWNIPATRHGVAMDIILKPLHTEFIQRAEAAGWLCLRGDVLFTAQALRQQDIWVKKGE